MTTVLVTIAIIALMIFFNALYVAAEFSTVSARRTKISQLAGQGNRMAGLLLPILEDPVKLDRYVAACQIGITISSLVLGAYAQSAIASELVVPIAGLLASTGITNDIDVATTLARSISVFSVLLFVTGLQVIFGELFPKSIAIQYPGRHCHERLLADAHFAYSLCVAHLALQRQCQFASTRHGSFRP